MSNRLGGGYESPPEPAPLPQVSPGPAQGAQHLPPAPGTREWQWWHRGAQAEYAAIVDSMSESGVRVYDTVATLAGAGRSADQIVRWVAVVFTGGWSLRERLRLAWRVVKRR